MDYEKFLPFFLTLIHWVILMNGAWIEEKDKSTDIQNLDEKKPSPIKLKKVTKETLHLVKWKGGNIPYKIAKNFPKEMRHVIEKAIKEWNQAFQNCTEWSHRQSEKDYVLFFKGPLCHSELGRVEGVQAIVLNDISCSDHGSVLHEMMHSAGFTHEHNRPDRDNFIRINFHNIPFDWRWQYVKEANFNFGDLGPYDYYSLMHYKIQSPDRRKPAFEILKTGIDENKIGQMQKLSETDKSKIRKLYCPEVDS